MTNESNQMPNSANSIKPPIWYWIISIIGLLWFLMDLSAFFMRVLISKDGIQALPENQQHLYVNIPLWVNVVFAFEVFGGTIGCIGLLLRKNWALLLFAFSLTGVLCQTFYVYFLSDAIRSMGAPAVVMPLLAIAIGTVMLILARSAKSKSWLR